MFLIILEAMNIPNKMAGPFLCILKTLMHLSILTPRGGGGGGGGGGGDGIPRGN